MERVGLAESFLPGKAPSAAKPRTEWSLIAIARRRAGNWPRGETVAVGDTPADISGARAAGIHVIGFGSGLEGADAVIERMSELQAALERLSAAP
jgi:phosphoglycolate phosphatase-like HAD superfamily hydrolase